MPRHEQPSLEALLPLLRCPVTGAQLSQVGGELVAPGVRYPLIGCVPIVVRDGHALLDRAALAEGARHPSAATSRRRSGAGALIRRFVPGDSRNVGIEHHLRVFRAELSGRTSNPRVLVIGGGVVGVGLLPLLTDPLTRVISSDVFPGPHTDVVCDGHELPFADGSFDGVVCQAVLEHVIDPQRVVDEIRRVLAPDGVVLSDVPFMQQVHEGAFDFMRFTMSGHRLLYRWFDIVASGVSGGPAMALAWSARYFASAVLATTPGRRGVVMSAVRLFTWWLPHIDRRLVGRQAALDAAAGTILVGRLRDSPVSDREIVDFYRGTVDTPTSY